MFEAATQFISKTKGFVLNYRKKKDKTKWQYIFAFQASGNTELHS